MIFVSHDAYFIEHIASKILYLTNDNPPPELFEGDYSYFSYKLEQKEKVEKQNSTSTQSESKQARSYKEANKMRNRLGTLQRQSEKLLENHEKLEASIAMVEAEMAKEENYSDAETITSLVKKKETLSEKLHAEEHAWLELSEEIEELEAEIG